MGQEFQSSLAGWFWLRVSPCGIVRMMAECLSRGLVQESLLPGWLAPTAVVRRISSSPCEFVCWAAWVTCVTCPPERESRRKKDRSYSFCNLASGVIFAIFIVSYWSCKSAPFNMGRGFSRWQVSLGAILGADYHILSKSGVKHW